MERRALLAVVLCLLVWWVSELIFPTTPLDKQRAAADSAAAVAAAADSQRAAVATQPMPPPSPAAAVGRTGPASVASVASVAPVAPVAPVSAETLTVMTPHTVVAFSSVGATPVAVTMRDYHRTVRNVSEAGAPPLVRLGRPGETLLSYRIITPHDTLPLDRVNFAGRQTTAADGTPIVTYEASVPPGQGEGTTAPWHVVIAYTFKPDGYLSDVSGRVTGGGGGGGTDASAAPAVRPGFLLLDLPSGFPSFEADSTDDISQLAYVVKTARDDPVSTSFSRLDPGQSELRPGPVAWAAAKNKYFLVGVLAADTARAAQFAEVDLVGGPRIDKLATRGTATAVLPLTPVPGGAAFAFRLYAGPQEFRRLRAVGGWGGAGFENLNPYAGFLHPILQPFVTITVETVLWLKQVLRINYGWVLVIFGVGTRLLLWPVNQRVMRTSLKMQRLQPELTEVQAKYKDDKERQQQEIMRVYREHGMSPWSPIAGCLPMLLPWPIFAALYFVFRNTIEFRGVPFLWLHDISVKDPHYILPLLMGASSFLVSWIGMRNAPPNPQTKMMGYLFPAMMTYFFWRIAAGLNLYYLVQSLATLPQQWLLSNERARSAGASAAGGGPSNARAPAGKSRPGGGSTSSLPAAGRS